MHRAYIQLRNYISMIIHTVHQGRHTFQQDRHTYRQIDKTFHQDRHTFHHDRHTHFTKIDGTFHQDRHTSPRYTHFTNIDKDFTKTDTHFNQYGNISPRSRIFLNPQGLSGPVQRQLYRQLSKTFFRKFLKIQFGSSLDQTRTVVFIRPVSFCV